MAVPSLTGYLTLVGGTFIYFNYFYFYSLLVTSDNFGETFYLAL